MAVISRGLYLSVTSGALAATASVFGKLAMSPSICCHLFNAWYQLIGVFNDGNNWCHSSDTSLMLRSFQAVMFVAMIITNLLMWTQFTKALKEYTNSLHVIVVNTSTNFFLTVNNF
ncbi:unnamed protein product [Medioppia subpectinata]|uniref:Uncharacterized protein n=1 Tax=Medioppia subpectinata TaxID=1979941 RepID=A0A7R9KEN5_9ACAR|nr:unnamed protein product [Medioppia subpectinata]CAG2101947.1 unnamed protein product [Medioppia subpectinata]